MTLLTTQFNFDGQTNLYKGKVRDVYTINDTTLVTVATDRISAFDVILPNPIPHKGQVLNQLAAYFLQTTKHIAPNWLLDVPDPNASVGIKCKPFPIEMVIRGYLTGHAWRVYQSGVRELCGVTLPDGMQEFDKFEQPIITPSTKAEVGHDEDISAEQIVAQGLASKEDFEQLSTLTHELFAFGQAQAQEKGLILADTKYEFGWHDGKIYIIDEIHTPDSSRYFYNAGFEEFMADRTSPRPQNLSKEFVRQWLLDNGFSGQEGQAPPQMSEEFIESVSQRYIDLYCKLTGEDFVYPNENTDISTRIQQNVEQSLRKIK